MNDLLALLAGHGIAVVFLVTLAARIGAPVPAVPFLIVAGGLSFGGQVSWVAVALAAVFANILGDGVWFLAGRRWGYRVMRLLCRISLSADSCVKRSESILGRWGGLSLIAAKFVPGVSVVAPPMAGALGMSMRRFLVYETVGALIWTLGLLLVGRLFHSTINDVLAVLSNIGLGALVVLAVALAAFLAWRYHQRRLARRVDDIDLIAVDELRLALAGAGAPVVVDVRTTQSRAIDPRAIPGALHIDFGHLPDQVGQLSNGRAVVVFCDCPADASAIAAARVLMAGGLPRVRVLAGGLDAWVASDEPPHTETDPRPAAAAWMT
ncbi:VTT domain-containing protein [Variovorax ginsengisoli]|uniref:Membrane protein DedA with SNARE-associated domain/rhodanese-related sulfurtransferase n=1 Tax=Variovorax ginsengisoli TaxID=363844 RepID=A0ABT9S1K7_9BURK|nr:VTT domain-containing protein [Variovorax ginsengisoli]MDP9898236.1 membrane protein DedA with SNARE-associated domain/rhodanese-related sulfurtransferase [Variovorax ginsengisoli]